MRYRLTFLCLASFFVCGWLPILLAQEPEQGDLFKDVVQACEPAERLFEGYACPLSLSRVEGLFVWYPGDACPTGYHQIIESSNDITEETLNSEDLETVETWCISNDVCPPGMKLKDGRKFRAVMTKENKELSDKFNLARTLTCEGETFRDRQHIKINQEGYIESRMTSSSKYPYQQLCEYDGKTGVRLVERRFFKLRNHGLYFKFNAHGNLVGLECNDMGKKVGLLAEWYDDGQQKLRWDMRMGHEGDDIITWNQKGEQMMLQKSPDGKSWRGRR